LFVRGKSLGIKFSCLVVSDGFPHWLLALRPMDWATIHWMQFAPTPSHLLPLLETFLPTLRKSLAPVSFEALHFARLSASVDVVLFSGSEYRLTQITSFKTSVPIMCISGGPLTAFSCSLITSLGLKIHRWRHKMLGGVTNGNLLVGCRQVDFSEFRPPLRRNVKHILDFGSRPKSCVQTPSFRHYKATNVVRMNELALPVVYKSPHFCHTGWGSRQLSLGEIGKAFDLPGHCEALIVDTSLFSELFPLKLLSEPL
jgi:hypothetical protein